MCKQNFRKGELKKRVFDSPAYLQFELSLNLDDYGEKEREAHLRGGREKGYPTSSRI